MPARPSPLITKGHGIMAGAAKSPFSPLPSELPRTPIGGHFDAIKNHDEAMKTPITPPTAYTEFLKATVNSPAVSSVPPTSLPYSPALSTASSYHRHSGYYTPATPYPPPMSAALSMRRSRRMPPSPSSANTSPSTESPRSARSTRSCPDDDEDDDDEDGAQLSDGRVTVKQTVTTTVTYTPRMALMPAPKGKRRRIA